jgi:hypothetical protein
VIVFIVKIMFFRFLSMIGRNIICKHVRAFSSPP